MPDRKNASHGNIQTSPREGVHLLGVEKQVDDALIHLDAAVGTVHQLVDGAEIFQALKAVVDGKEAVVFLQLRKDSAL